MTSPLPSFLRPLGDALGSVCATDRDGALIPLDRAFAGAVDLVRGQTALGRKVIFIGNGGSASIASHQAVDYWKNGRMRAIAFNDAALLTCVGNDFGYPELFQRPIEMFADAGDVLIAISSSGRSENILRGAEAGAACGCRIVTLSGFEPDNPLRRRGELNFFVAARSYGHVEITHLAVCHAVVDHIVSAKETDAADRLTGPDR